MDPQYIEAARGCGMTPYQRLYKIEIPLALPTIIGGLRMSTIYTVSWTVLAAMIGQVVWARSFTLESAPMTTDSS